MSSDRTGYDYFGWELDPSTRVSTHIWTKWSPVNVTLATPGSAETLFSASTEIPTVNLATNPSFETGTPPTNYTAVGATLTRVDSGTFAPRSGTYCIESNPDNAATGEGFYYTTIALGSQRSEQPLSIVVSAYFADAGASGSGVRIEIRDYTGAT